MSAVTVGANGSHGDTVSRVFHRKFHSCWGNVSLVSAGLADATFTLTPKHKWDVAAGAALVLNAGGYVRTLENSELRCNNKSPLLSGLLACGPNLREQLVSLTHDRG